MQSSWNLHILLLEMQNNTATMENILEFSYKPTLILWSGNLIPRLPKRNKDTCLHKDLYESVYSSFVPNQTAENKTNIHHLMGRQTSCGTSIQWK